MYAHREEVFNSLPIWISSEFSFLFNFWIRGAWGASGMDPARSGDRFAQIIVKIGALGVEFEVFLRRRLKIDT